MTNPQSRTKPLKLLRYHEVEAINVEAGAGASSTLGSGILGAHVREQRHHDRVRYRDPVQGHLIGGRPPLQGYALLAEDLCEMGLMFTAYELFPVGSRLLLWLDVAEIEERIRVVGRVIWVAQEAHQERYRHGFQFEEIGLPARQQLRTLVDRRASGI